MLVFDGDYPVVHPKAKFWQFLVKNCEKSAVKHSIKKPSLLNFENFSPIFCPKLSKEADFYFELGPDPITLYFLKILVFEKTHSLFKLIFKEIQLQKCLNMISFKKLFCTLGSSMHFGQNVVPVATGDYLWRGFFLSTKNWSFLGF